jgi:hypothetical protein
MLEHTHRNDAVERAFDVAIIDQAEFGLFAMAALDRPVLRAVILLL